MDWPQPENSQDVRGFLGSTSYYGTFFEHYAHIAMPFYAIGTPPKGKGDFGRPRGELRKVKRTQFGWERECQHAFDTLNKALCNPPGLALPDHEAKYCLHVDARQYVFGAVLSQVQDKAEKVQGYFSCNLHNPEMRYPTYDRELLGIRDTIIYWKFNLHGAEQLFLVHTDHATLRWIHTQPHHTVRQMDIVTMVLYFNCEVKHIPGVKNRVTDAISHHPDCQREGCNGITLEDTASREWIQNIQVGIIDDKWFEPIALSLANPSPHPLSSTASTTECKGWGLSQRFNLDENGLLCLCGDLAKQQVEKTATAKKKDDEEVEIAVRTKVKGEVGNTEQVKEEKTEKRGQLCISKTMLRRIIHETHDTPAEGHFGADRTSLLMKDRYFWQQMWHHTQGYIGGCDLGH